METAEMFRCGTRRCIAIALLGCGSLLAQQSGPRPMNDKDVVRMAKAGISESNILRAFQKGSCDFDVSPDALTELKTQGVPDTVVAAMQNCQDEANKLAPAAAKYVTGRQSALRGIAVVQHMVTLAELKERYPDVFKNDKEAPISDSERFWQFGKSMVVISEVATGSPASKVGHPTGRSST